MSLSGLCSSCIFNIKVKISRHFNQKKVESKKKSKRTLWKMSRRPNLPTHTPTTISTLNTQQSSLLIIIQNLTHWNSTWTKNHKILLLSDFFDIKYRSVVGNIFQEIRLESQKPFSSLSLPSPHPHSISCCNRENSQVVS